MDFFRDGDRGGTVYAELEKIERERQFIERWKMIED